MGGGDAPASVTKFYLSSDATYDAADVELGQRPVTALTNGSQDYNQVGVTLTIPPSTAAGNYFLLARANAAASPVPETNATNNTNTDAVSVVVAGADLVVSALTVALSGESTLTITDTTKNQGTGDAGASTTRFYFSTDGSFDEATDVLLGSRAVGALAAGATSDGTSTFPLPAGTQPGHLHHLRQGRRRQRGGGERRGNNRRCANLDTRGSDLIITNFSVHMGHRRHPQRQRHHQERGPGHGGCLHDALLPVDGCDLGPGDAALGTPGVLGSLAAGNQSTAPRP